MHWEARLSGEDFDLSQAKRLCNNQRISINKVDEQWFLSSSEFEGLKDASEVHSRAKKIAVTLSGALNILNGYKGSLSVDSVHKLSPEGKRSVTILAEPVNFTIRTSFTATLTKSDGTVETRSSEDPTNSWMELSFENKKVSKIFRLTSMEWDWVNMYRIYEVIQSDVGKKTNEWISGTDLERFKHSANSVEVAGDASRHGKEKTQPPKNPMEIKEAKILMRGLVTAWLDSKK